MNSQFVSNFSSLGFKMQEFQKIIKKRVPHGFDKKMPSCTFSQKFTYLGNFRVKNLKTFSQTLRDLTSFKDFPAS